MGGDKILIKVYESITYESFHSLLQAHRQVYQRNRRSRKLPGLPPIQQKPEVRTILENEETDDAMGNSQEQTTHQPDNRELPKLDKAAVPKRLCSHGTAVSKPADKNQKGDVIDMVTTANITPYKKLPKIETPVALVNIGEQTHSSKKLSRLRV